MNGGFCLLIQIGIFVLVCLICRLILLVWFGSFGSTDLVNLILYILNNLLCTFGLIYLVWWNWFSWFGLVCNRTSPRQGIPMPCKNDWKYNSKSRELPGKLAGVGGLCGVGDLTLIIRLILVLMATGIGLAKWNWLGKIIDGSMQE